MSKKYDYFIIQGDDTMLNKNGNYVVYLRKSRKDTELENKTDEETLARHERILKESANRYGIGISKIYREVKSGDSIAARPQMQRLLSEISEGLWDGVMVVEIERLARGDSIDQGIVSRALQETGTLIITPGKVYDPKDEADEEFFEFSLFMSRREYKTIKRRMNRGRIAASKEGKYCANRPPYGYDREKIQGEKGYKLVINEREAEGVRKIFDWYVNGIELDDGSRQQAGTTIIAEKLTELGIKPRCKEKWSYSTVSGILKNPVYIGKITWAGRKKVRSVKPDGSLIMRYGHENDTGIVLSSGLHDPIISDQLYFAAQEKMEKYREENKKRIQSSDTISNSLSGIVRCKFCGKNLFYRKSGKKSPRDSMICATKGCENIGCYYDDLEEKIVKSIEIWAKNKTIFLNSEYSKRLSERILFLKKAIKKSDQNIFSINGQLEKIFESYEKGIYDEETFLVRSSSVKAKKENEEKSINKLKEELKELQRIERKESNIIPKIQTLAESYEKIDDPAQKNRMLKEIIDHVDYVKTEKSKRGGPHDNFEITIYPKIDYENNIN